MKEPDLYDLICLFIKYVCIYKTYKMLHFNVVVLLREMLGVNGGFKIFESWYAICSLINWVIIKHDDLFLYIISTAAMLIVLLLFFQLYCLKEHLISKDVRRPWNCHILIFPSETTGSDSKIYPIDPNSIYKDGWRLKIKIENS